MDIDAQEILRETRGESLGAPADVPPVHRISTDTRLLEKNDAFFALTGKRYDGHDFIAQALEKGARHFVVSDRAKLKAEWLRAANFILVADTLQAYGDLARAYRRKFKVPAVAITGSTGKTTVKELLAHLLSSKFKTLKNRGTENNLIGVPKTLFQMDRDTETVVLELGTSSPGEIERLSSIVHPQIAVLTQIGHSHLEGLKDLGGVREEKLKILKNLERGGLFVSNGEDPSLAGVSSGVHRLVRVGFDRAHADATAERITIGADGTTFHWNGVKMQTSLVGRHNVLNGLLAIQCATALGVAAEAIQKSIASFKPVPGRLALKTVSDLTFLDDSYNSNPTSFRAALETLEELRAQGRKGVFCGDMLELGAQSEALHRELGRRIAHSHLDYVVAAGGHSAALVEEAVREGFPKDHIFHAKDSVEAGKIGQKLAAPGDLILVKGSRGMQMERIFDCFTSCSTR